MDGSKVSGLVRDNSLLSKLMANLNINLVPKVYMLQVKLKYRNFSLLKKEIVLSRLIIMG